MTKQESIDSLKKILDSEYGFSAKTTQSIYKKSEELMGHIWNPKNMHNAIIFCFEDNPKLVPRMKEFGGIVLTFEDLVPRYLW